MSIARKRTSGTTSIKHSTTSRPDIYKLGVNKFSILNAGGYKADGSNSITGILSRTRKITSPSDSDLEIVKEKDRKAQRQLVQQIKLKVDSEQLRNNIKLRTSPTFSPA